MKTIFITSFHSLISRNILGSGLLEMLSENNRIIILAPNLKKDYFIKEFSKKNILVEGVDSKIVLSKKDFFFHRVRLFISPSKTMRIKKRAEILEGRNFMFILSEVVSFLLGRSHLFLKVFRFFDYFFVQKKVFSPLFAKYEPDLIFSTDVQNQIDERLLQEAKKAGIKTIGMVRSWDNLTAKGILRVWPDWLIVNNEIIKSEAIKYNGFPSKNICVVGVPHYDRYILPPVQSKKEFFERLNFDLNKKTILYAVIGDRYIKNNQTDKMVFEALGGLNVNLLVRQPPADSADFAGAVSERANFYIDEPGTRIWQDGRKTNELSKENEEHFVSSIFYSDLVVAGPSTTVIDAAIFNKPVILINFDSEPRPYYNSLSRHYDYDHLQAVLRSGGAKLVNDKNELLNWVKKYLDNPELDKEGRKMIIEQQCWKLDGQSTKRLADCILSFV